MENEQEQERRMVFARELAAQAWTKETTSSTVMDVVLAEEFAKILVEEMYKPRLGCATTQEIIDELETRVHFLKYRTIDSID